MASYGTEILFPFQVDQSGRIGFTDNPYQIVQQRIEQIVFTLLGERVMRPNFGSGAEEFLFDNVGHGKEVLIVDRIKTAVNNLTDGIIIKAVTLDTSSILPTGTLKIGIQYSFEYLGDFYTSEFITNVGVTQHTIVR